MKSSMLEFTIDNNTYQIVKTMIINGKSYCAFKDQENIISISEYEINNGNINLIPIDDKEFDYIKGEFKL